MTKHAGSPCSCGNPNCAAGQQAAPTTVRGWAHRMIDIANLRRADGSGTGGNMLCYERPENPAHSVGCIALCEQLCAFGPWWVSFTAANREANKDQRPQVAAEPPREGETWRLKTGHERTEILGARRDNGGFVLRDGGWIDLDRLLTYWERVPHTVDVEQPQPPSFARELASILNRHSRENASDTPDFILASFIDGCLHAFETTTLAREGWYGRTKKAQPTVVTGPQPPDAPTPTAAPVSSSQELRDLAVGVFAGACTRFNEAYAAAEKQLCAAAVESAARALDVIYEACRRRDKEI